LRTAAILALACTLSYGAAETAPKKPQSKSAAGAKRATKAKSSTRHKSTAKAGKTSSSSRGKTTARSGKISKKSKTASRRGKKSGSASAAAWRSRQLAPTPERYKEIQSALVQRGYLKKDPNGVWDADSADALRRFQQDQSLEATGKLNSLSLIALGLGPKHPATLPAPAPAAPQAAPPPGPAPAPVPAPASAPAAPAPESPGPAPSGPVVPDNQP
jgi:hypothetical protein